MVAGYEALKGDLHWSKRWTATIIFAFLGTVLLIGVFSFGEFRLQITPLGLGAGLIAAITGAYYSLASRQLVREKGSWWLTTWGFLVGGAIMIPVGLFSLGVSPLPSYGAELATVSSLVIFVIIFGTILSFGLYMAGLRRLHATETGVAASIEPIVASIAAYLFLGVRLDPLQYLGGALIVIAVIFVASSRQPEANIQKIPKTEWKPQE
jgi:drug/metabolite transporter (DMT)-like permease